MLYPYFLTILNAPITLFEIFPFIFLLTSQFLFYDLFKKNELNLFKTNGLSNFKIIQILFILSIAVGVFTVSVYYNAASILKFHYTSIKNEFSNDFVSFQKISRDFESHWGQQKQFSLDFQRF